MENVTPCEILENINKVTTCDIQASRKHDTL